MRKDGSRYFLGYGWLLSMNWNDYLLSDDVQYSSTEHDYCDDIEFDIVFNFADCNYYYTKEGSYD